MVNWIKVTINYNIGSDRMKNYTEDAIKILDGIEHIRLRPGMYVGSMQDPTHLLYEVLDNSIDEAMINKSSLTVNINLDDYIYEVIDNGRGIPLGNINDPKYGNLPIPVIIASQINSSGKFDKNSYDISIGLHGVGLVVVNALSDWLTIDSKKENKRKIFKFENGQWDKNIIEDNSIDYSTKISFKPCKKYFKKISLNMDKLKRRLFLVSANSNIKIYLNITKNKKLENIVYEHNMYQYFEYIYPYMKDKIKYKINVNGKKGERLRILFGYDFDNLNSQNHGSINLLSVDQGTHINKTILSIKNMFFDFNKDKDVLKDDFGVGLNVYVDLLLRNPTFSSQTKERLTNDYQDIKYLVDQLIDKLKKYFSDNYEELKIVLDNISDYRSRLNNKKNIKSKIIRNSRLSRGLTSSDSRLRDCSTREIDSTRLFIVEGMSAAGSLIQCRNPKIDAVLPLRGKILNVLNSTDEKTFKNKEILDMVNSIGVGTVHTGIHLDKIRYSQIVILTDADYDGFHIATLLIAAFIELIPDVVKEGLIYYAVPPLFGMKEKGNFIPLFDEQEAFKLIDNGKNLTRYKGLGEMNPDELELAILNKKYKKWLQVNYPENEQDREYINSLFTNTDEKRKLLFGGDNL
jgi:DNA gyrase subunit B